MKKYIIYIVILATGLLMGWFLFGNNTSNEQHDHKEQKVIEHWTCSMHPQIDLPEFGSCPICGMDLIPKSDTEEGLSIDQFKMTENAIALANIETVVVGDVADTSKSLTLSGKISTNEKASAIQAAHFGGRIEKLNFKTVGEYVSKGSIIASIYSPELVTAQNELIEAISIKESQPELYKAVRNKLKYWKISEKQIQGIEETKKVQSNFAMYANVSGYISEIFVDEGNHVKEGMPLFNVANLESVWADFDVYEQDIKNLKVGQAIEIGLNAYPDKIIKAKIDYIDPILDNNTRTVSVRATLQNRDDLLKPGMIITSKLKVDSNTTNELLISVPKSAVMWTGKRSIVYVKTSSITPIFELREVILGNEVGEYYEVLNGLKSGDEIVFNGTFTVDAAAQLQGKTSMMNRVSNVSNTEKDISEIKDMILIDKSKINVKFKQQLGIVVSDYIILKDALVKDDFNHAQKQAGKVKKSLTKVDMLLLKGDAHNEWMRFLKSINKSIEIISNTDDIKNQRKAFLNLSKNLSQSIKTFGINTKGEKTVYLEFCPMADDNNGGFWLSYDKKIKNPYFGKAMLTCGKVIETYK